MELFPIRNDEDHARAVSEIARLWEAEDGSAEADYMDALATLVDRYERQRWPIASPSPVEVLRFMMEQNGYRQTDLASLLGSRSRASEILNGRRPLTLEQIRLLASRWRIPVSLLVGELSAA